MSVNSNTNANLTKNLTLSGSTWTVGIQGQINSYPNPTTFGSLITVANNVGQSSAAFYVGLQQGDAGYGARDEMVAYVFRETPGVLDFASAVTGGYTGWFFYMITCDGTNIKLYARKAADAAPTLLVTSANPITPLRFDIFTDPFNEQYADANAVDYWIFDGVAFSADQVHAQSFKQRPIIGPTVWLQLLNTTSPGVDKSGNGNDFTVNNTVAAARSMPPITWGG